MSQIEAGELLYEYTLNITGLTEYGTSLANQNLYTIHL